MKADRSRPESPRSILVLKPSSFGDIIHALPAVARLKERWPDSRVSWLVNVEWSPLLLRNPVVDEVVLFPRRELRGVAGVFRTLSWLRTCIAGRRPDLTLDYQGLLRTALIGCLAGGKYFAGMADAREGACWLYDEAVAIPATAIHAVDRYLALSDAMTGTESPARVIRPVEFPLPQGQPINDAQRLENRYILLHPFSRGADKSLTVSQVQALCAELSPVQMVVVGNRSGADFTLPTNGLNLLNQTSLLQLISLVQNAGFVISVDSGPVHLAAALNKPLVAIHTWSDPRRVGPYLSTARVLKNGKLLRVAELRTLADSFFTPPSGEVLSSPQMSAICRLATSPSGSFA